MCIPNVVLLILGIGFLYGGLRTLILCLRKAYPVEMMRGKMLEACVLLAFGLAAIGGILLLRIIIYGSLTNRYPPLIIQ